MAKQILDIHSLEENLCRAAAYMSVTARAESAIIFVGTTKSGKSTLVNYLIGNKLTGRKIGYKISIQKADNSHGPKIGDAAASETTIPDRYVSDKLPGYALWDVPGYDDNRGLNQDICNAFYTYELYKIITSAKIVLVVNIATFQDDSMNAMRSLLRTVESLLKDKFKSSFPGIAMIVTKAGILNGVEVTKEFVTEVLDTLLTDGIDVSECGQDFVRYLISHPQNIGFFKMATVGPITDVIEDGIIEAINSVQAVPDHILKQISPSICELAKASLLEAREQLSVMQTLVELQELVDNVLRNRLKHIENRQNEELTNTELSDFSLQLSVIKESMTRVLNGSISFEREIHALKMTDAQIEAYIDQKKLCEMAKCIEFVDKLLDTNESLNFTLCIKQILSHAMQKVDELLVWTECSKAKMERDQVQKEIAKVTEKHEQEIRKLEYEKSKLANEKKEVEKKFQDYKNSWCTIS